MTPERAAGLVARWARVYTRGLPPSIAERRIGEIDADLHDHIAHERAGGTGERRIALRVASRMVRGLPADATWRGHTIAKHSTRKDPMKPTTPAARSVLRVALVTGLLLLVPAVLMQFDGGTDWGVFDFVFAGVLLAGTGALIELAVRQPRNLVLRAIAGAVGVAAIVLGELDDAPGLVLFGGLLIAGTLGLTFMTAQRSR